MIGGGFFWIILATNLYFFYLAKVIPSKSGLNKNYQWGKLILFGALSQCFSLFVYIIYTEKLGNFEEKQHIYYLPNIISDVGNKSTGVMHYAYIQ